MALYTRRAPPNLPKPPDEYDAAYFTHLVSMLTLYFQQNNAVQPLNLAGLNLDINTLPTQATLSTLRSGDVYRDTSAGNVLKVKP